MLPARRHCSEWPPERFLRWAEKIRSQTRARIEAVLTSRKHPKQAYRTCLGVLGLAKRYSQARLPALVRARAEAACRRALLAGIRSYGGMIPKDIGTMRISWMPASARCPAKDRLRLLRLRT
ncbi:MAG: hypothetical protein BMS9Abin28_1966 [Anaerolineae bacterium]|nr:MAG: hypothetical protein BMS9Abin28_1966 [Anaerolineae bacterium]